MTAEMRSERSLHCCEPSVNSEKNVCLSLYFPLHPPRTLEKGYTVLSHETVGAEESSAMAGKLCMGVFLPV